MTIFDLLFIAIFLAALTSLAAALVSAWRGRRAGAMAILRRLGVGLIAYVAVVAAVGLLSPQRILEPGDPWCFDDWCLSVQKVTSTPAPPQVTYDVSLRIFSQARRVSQRALGAWIYLVDAQGNRYAPEPDSSAVPLDVRLGPAESVSITRVFRVPAGHGELGLITGHGGGPGALILAGDSSLLHKPTYIRIAAAR